jgi:hypothetical protein
MADLHRPDAGQDPGDLATIGRLLAEPPPAPGVVEAARLRLARLATGPALPPHGAATRPLRRPARPSPHPRARRRPGPSRPPRSSRWLAAAAAAAAVAVVVAASVLVTRMVGERQGGTAATGPAAIAQVPRFFVMIRPVGAGPAVVSATATGKVLGVVPVPRPARVFSLVAASGDGREFVLAASRGPVASGAGPTRLYLLKLSPSGRPGPLIPLPIGTQAREITGLALSRDGRQLAMGLDPPGGQHTGATIRICSLATGAGRDWVWPGTGFVGSNYLEIGEFAARTLSWTADGSRLLFQVNTGRGTSQRTQIRLLDATGPGGDLRTSSQRLSVPSNELGHYGKPAPVTIHPPLLVTGDGTRAVAPTSRVLERRPGHPDDPMLAETISEFPVAAGQPVRAVYRQNFTYDTDPAVFWVNDTGSTLIIFRPAATFTKGLGGAFGVLTPDGFTPFPAAVQHRLLSLQPDW